MRSVISAPAWSLVGLTLALLGSASLAQAQGQHAIADQASAWYEKERIFVQVSIINSEHEDAIDSQVRAQMGREWTNLYGERFGNPVGSVIPLRVRIFAVDPKPGQLPVRLDVSTLRANPPRFTLQQQPDPNWRIALSDATENREALNVASLAVQLPWGGKTYSTELTQISMLVQTFKDPRQRIPFWLEFKYSTSNLPDGTPDWKAVNTPAWSVDMSPTMDPGNDLSLGDLNPAEQTRPRALGWGLVSLSVLILAWIFVFRATAWLRRRFPQAHSMDAREKLWATLRPILKRTKNGSGFAFRAEDLSNITAAVAEYAQVESWSSAELWNRRFERTDGERWFNIIAPLKGAEQQSALLPAERCAEIVNMIRTICPEP